MVTDLEVSIFAGYGKQMLYGDEIYKGSCLRMGPGPPEQYLMKN